MPWPPSSIFLLSNTKAIPELLIFFVTELLYSKSKAHLSQQKERIVMSLCQDICFGVTKGKWLLPKHLLLGMTVRHETGSAKLVKYLNRFGHCTSHSKLLELETAMYESILVSESHLPCAAITNAKMTHLCWDNFDLCEEIPNGSGTTHSTSGIIIQEQPDGGDGISNSQSVVERTKRRSSIYRPIVLNHYFYNNFVEPD